MRHTRNRQMGKIDSSNWKGEKNHPIERERKKYLAHKLDQTFKWHRDFEGFKNDNVIEFGGDEYSYGTHFKAKTKCW